MFTNVPDRDDDRAVLLRIERPADTDGELLSALLFDLGATGIEERGAPPEAQVLLAGFPNRLMAAEALTRLPAECRPRALVDIPDDTWFDGWRAYARAQRAGRHLIVHPPWVALDLELQPGDLVLQVDPGRSFGSGAHPTTRLVLAELERLVGPGSSVLDLGCGSGVLSVAAARLGAGRVVAVDIDPAALAATAANLDRNGIDPGVVTVTDALPDAGPDDEGAPLDGARFDVVAANIGANALMALAPDVVRLGRRLVLSGFFAERAGEVTAAYGRCDATLSSTLAGELEGWVALTLCTDPAEG